MWQGGPDQHDLVLADRKEVPHRSGHSGSKIASRLGKGRDVARNLYRKGRFGGLERPMEAPRPILRETGGDVGKKGPVKIRCPLSTDDRSQPSLHSPGLRVAREDDERSVSDGSSHGLLDLRQTEADFKLRRRRGPAYDDFSMKVVSAHPKLRSKLATRGFVAAALLLCLGSAAMALASFLKGDLGQGFLLSAVSIFSGWMAAAVQQFQQRIAGIDEVVHQARRRVEQSETVLAEMRQLARRLRATASPEDNEEDRTIH